jgi:hypothetical protein
MADRKLFPKSGSPYLTPTEVIARLHSHFRHVETDPDGGAAYLNSMVAQLTRMQDLSPPPAAPEEVERLRSLRGEAVSVVFCDDPRSEYAYLATTVIPETPLFFGFSSAHQEEASAELLARCASVLGYEITGGPVT